MLFQDEIECCLRKGWMSKALQRKLLKEVVESSQPSAGQKWSKLEPGRSKLEEGLKLESWALNLNSTSVELYNTLLLSPHWGVKRLHASSCPLRRATKKQLPSMHRNMLWSHYNFALASKKTWLWYRISWAICCHCYCILQTIQPCFNLHIHSAPTACNSIEAPPWQGFPRGDPKQTRPWLDHIFQFCQERNWPT